MKKNMYRCSCCNEVKNESNAVYKMWDTKKKPENCTIVVICRRCNFAMIKAKCDRVEKFTRTLQKLK